MTDFQLVGDSLLLNYCKISEALHHFPASVSSNRITASWLVLGCNILKKKTKKKNASADPQVYSVVLQAC